VKPYQPPGLWEAVAYPSSNTAKFKADEGEALWRRSLYTFWKRTSPPPAMALFDAPNRESCTVRRSRTNTPLQALALLNDVQFVEAARALAQRVLLEPVTSDRQRLEYLFNLVLARPPELSEFAILENCLQQQQLAFSGDEAAARELLAVGAHRIEPNLDPGRLAAWTLVGNLVLNLDEAITKR
jgi:hypothetical protein